VRVQRLSAAQLGVGHENRSMAGSAERAKHHETLYPTTDDERVNEHGWTAQRAA